MRLPSCCSCCQNYLAGTMRSSGTFPIKEEILMYTSQPGLVDVLQATFCCFPSLGVLLFWCPPLLVSSHFWCPPTFGVFPLLVASHFWCPPLYTNIKVSPPTFVLLEASWWITVGKLAACQRGTNWQTLAELFTISANKIFTVGAKMQKTKRIITPGGTCNGSKNCRSRVKVQFAEYT